MLVAKNLCKSFKGEKIVNSFSIQVNRGEIVGLLGSNGAGKTTAFYMVAGIVKPDSGDIFMNSQKITELPMYLRARQGLGYLPQESSIFKELTVAENIMSILQITQKNQNIREDLLSRLLEEFSISHLRRVSAASLSGGEKRRVEIARCLASNPSYVMLDEPFAGVDPISITDIKNLIIHLKNNNVGVLITDHNVRDALSLMDQIYIMHEGSVIHHGERETILKDAKVKEFYLGENFAI